MVIDKINNFFESIYRYFTFGYIKIDDFELIIIDECHHCRRKDFYNRIFQHFIFNNGFNNNIKILGLTASPCEEWVLEENLLKSKIQELCNNMGCYLICPKNLIKENDDNKELIFLEITDENEDEIRNKKSIKKNLFHNVIMPFLDFHFQLIYEKITLPYQNNNLGLNNKLVEKEIGNE